MEFLDLKVPGKWGFIEWGTTQKIFPLNTMTKTFASKCLLRAALHRKIYQKMQKNFVFGEFDKNINFSSY